MLSIYTLMRLHYTRQVGKSHVVGGEVGVNSVKRFVMTELEYYAFVFLRVLPDMF